MMERDGTAAQPILVIAVAPNGARRLKSDHPALPLSPVELADTAEACLDEGASVLHLHVRENDGTHSLDPDRYRDALDAIERRIGGRMLIQVTSEAAGRYDASQQIAAIRTLRPRAVSVALREVIPTPGDETAAADFFAWTRSAHCAVQYILYTAEEAEWLQSLVKRGLVPDPAPNALFVLGRYSAGQVSSPRGLLPFLRTWPEAWPWSLCAFGPTEALCMSAAIALGGHVRVGFENNICNPDGSVAASNADAVRTIFRLAQTAGRSVANVRDARAVYGALA